MSVNDSKNQVVKALDGLNNMHPLEESSEDAFKRDELLVKLMIHTYDEEVNRNELIDSKNSQMIVLTGAMLTLQATLFTNLLAQKVLFNAQMSTSWKILLSIVMLCSLGLIMLALSQFIKSFQFKKSFKQAPNPSFLLKMHNDEAFRIFLKQSFNSNTTKFFFF